MKNISVLIASIIFSTLFYKQDIGLNLSLFSVVTAVILILNNKNSLSNKRTLFYGTCYLASAIATFLFKSNLTIVANCLAFLTLIGSISQHQSSIYVNWLNGAYTSVAGFFHRNYEFDKDEEAPKLKQELKIDYLHWFKIIGIPLTVVIIFIGLYKNGNPVFNDFISRIDFSFISLQWILLTLFGYYLFNNIVTPVIVEPSTQYDINTGNALQKTKDFSEEELKKENQLGNILIVLLNILIAFYLVTDIAHLINTKDLTASELSNQLHSGVNALIASIVIAIIVILYFFRGDLNFYKLNKNLKKVTYLWLLLNSILIIVIAIKNYQYIHSFGFTYKRIGVNIYLLLTFIGLCTTLFKVLNIKNIVYLWRINLQSAFVILILCGLLNWDSIITSYNLNYAKVIDMDYLINLSNNNTFQLKKYSDNNILPNQYRNLISNKHYNYVKELKKENWQEMHYNSFRVNSNNSSN